MRPPLVGRLAGTILLAAVVGAAAEMPPPLPPLREQDEIRQGWLKARLERVLPPLMRSWVLDRQTRYHLVR